jgi:hypothetical protein
LLSKLQERRTSGPGEGHREFFTMNLDAETEHLKPDAGKYRMLALYVGDRYSAPPVRVRQVTWPAIIASFVFLLWAWWFDSHRTASSPGRETFASSNN